MTGEMSEVVAALVDERSKRAAEFEVFRAELALTIVQVRSAIERDLGGALERVADGTVALLTEAGERHSAQLAVASGKVSTEVQKSGQAQ